MEIKEWIKSEYGLKVSSLYMDENKSHVPKCPPEKENAIIAAFKHFNMM